MAQGVQDFVVIQADDLLKFQEAVSNHLNAGYKLHGELQLQVSADLGSPTARLYYIQAVVRYGVPSNYPM